MSSIKETAQEDIEEASETRHEISVQSSLRRRRSTIIISIVCGISLLVTLITITAILLKDTRGINVKHVKHALITTRWPPINKTTAAAATPFTPETTESVKHVKHASITTRWPPINKTTSAATTPFTPETTESVFSWTEWSPWEPSNITCGYGIQQRMRSCNISHISIPRYGVLCKEPVREKRSYNLTYCRDCYEWYNLGKRQTDGIYSIDPDGRGPFPVYCDMTTDGGGWTVFQRRQDGSEDFYRDWEDYKTGFGNLTGEFWLGNEKLFRLTKLPKGLRVDLQDWALNTKYAEYKTFKVEDSTSRYRLSVASFTGTADDSLSRVHNGMQFSTRDNDNDLSAPHNCADYYHGAWWYNACYNSNLNGLYLENTINDEAVTWHGFNGSFLALKFTEMKLTSISKR